MDIKGLFEFFDKNNGKPRGMKWWQVGEMFGVEPQDNDRAKNSESYRRESIRKRTKNKYNIWKKLRTSNLEKLADSYVLSKYTKNKEGDIVFEQYKKENKDYEIDTTRMQVAKVSKSNMGITWITYKNVPDLEKNLDIIKKALLSDVRKYSKITPTNTNNKILLVYSSDKHYGSYVNEEKSMFKNKKEKPIMELIFESINKAVNDFGNFNKIIVFDLGDALDGFNAKTTRGLNKPDDKILPQNLDNIGQFETYLKEHKEFFVNLYQSGFANEYAFIGMGNSNHGGDFDYITFRTLEQYLNIAMPDIKTHVSRKFMDFIEIGNHVIIYTHGKDKENIKRPHPLHLDAKTYNYIIDWVVNNKITDKFVTVVGGDMHRSSMTDVYNIRYRKVLSQVGDTNYTQDNYGHNKAGISMDILNPIERRIYTFDDYFVNDILNITPVKF